MLALQPPLVYFNFAMTCSWYWAFSIDFIIILKFNFPVLLNLLGNISCIAQQSEQYGESILPILISQVGQYWICNWECLYSDSSQEKQWNIAWGWTWVWAWAWALGKIPWALPSAQARFDWISLLSSQYRYNVATCHQNLQTVCSTHKVGNNV